MGGTHIGKRKLKIGPRKDKEKKVKMTDGSVLVSDESIRPNCWLSRG
jgi:hypothetical protein